MMMHFICRSYRLDAEAHKYECFPYCRI